MSEGVPFGFDGSELLQLDWEAEDWDGNLGRRLMERLETAQNRRKRGVSFEDWKRRKEAENRLKSRLLKDIEAEERVEKTEKAQLKAQLRELNQAKVARWREQKKTEALLKRQQAKKTQKRLKAAEIAKRTESRLSYMNWLKADLGKRKKGIGESGHIRGKSVGSSQAARGFSAQGRRGQKEGKYREISREKAVYSVSAMRGYYGSNGPVSELQQPIDSSQDCLQPPLQPSKVLDDWSDIYVEMQNVV